MAAGAFAVVLLVAIGLIHVYWAAGGSAGKGAAVPTEGSRAVLRPGPLGTAAVAAGLFIMAATVAIRIGWLAVPAAGAAAHAAVWLFAAVFALRAIGDFRYVGVFKRVRETRFAQLDTRAFTPLCIVLAASIGVAAAS